MTNAANSSNGSAETTPGLPANGELSPWWKAWQKNSDWRDALHKKAAHKSLDIPEDDMSIQSSKTVNGIGTLGAIGIALAAGVPGAGVGLMALQMLANLPQAAPQPPAAPVSPPPVATAPAAAPDVERAFRILFFDKDRNPIEVKPFTPAD